MEEGRRRRVGCWSVDASLVDQAVVSETLEALVFVVVSNDIIETALSVLLKRVSRQTLDAYSSVGIVGEAFFRHLDALIVAEVESMSAFQAFVHVVAQTVGIYLGRTNSLRTRLRGLSQCLS